MTIVLQSNTDHLGPANTYFRRDLPMCASMTAAIVGCGDIAHAHACGYQLAGVDIIAYIDPLASLATSFGRNTAAVSATKVLRRCSMPVSRPT